tara:strand:+ start:1180 stop:1713 length:534 start_codon:yes stop_codon:yes gene_type:complete
MTIEYKGGTIHLPGTTEGTQYDEICRVFVKTTLPGEVFVAAKYSADNNRFKEFRYRERIKKLIKDACHRQVEGIKSHLPDLLNLYEEGVIKKSFQFERESNEATVHDFSVDRLIRRLMAGSEAGSKFCQKFQSYIDGHADYHFLWGDDLNHALKRFKRICSEKATILSKTASLFQSK